MIRLLEIHQSPILPLRSTRPQTRRQPILRRMIPRSRLKTLSHTAIRAENPGTSISEETQARQQAEERARNAEALLERTQRSPTDPAAPVPPARADESAIEARARQLADERVDGEKIQSVIRSGLDKFPDDWDSRAEMLGAVGAASPAFVLDVVSVDPDNAHVILHQLADDPQKAARLAKMNTRNRTIELVKMSMALAPKTETPPAAAKPAAPSKTMSKAPAPPPPVDPGASQVVDWRSDKATDQDFSRGWEAQQRERAARRR